MPFDIEANIERVLALLEQRGYYGVVQRGLSDWGSVYIEVVRLDTMKPCHIGIRVSDHRNLRHPISVDPTAMTPEQAVKEVLRELGSRIAKNKEIKMKASNHKPAYKVFKRRPGTGWKP